MLLTALSKALLCHAQASPVGTYSVVSGMQGDHIDGLCDSAVLCILHFLSALCGCMCSRETCVWGIQRGQILGWCIRLIPHGGSTVTGALNLAWV